MRHKGIIAFIVAFAVAWPAFAWDAKSTSKASSSADSVATASGGAGGVSYATINASDADKTIYNVPAALPPLPFGMCQRSDGTKAGFGWGFVDTAHQQSHTDLHCVDKVFDRLIELERAKRQPMQPTTLSYADPPRGPICTPLARTTRLGKGCT